MEKEKASCPPISNNKLHKMFCSRIYRNALRLMFKLGSPRKIRYLYTSGNKWLSLATTFILGWQVVATQLTMRFSPRDNNCYCSASSSHYLTTLVAVKLSMSFIKITRKYFLHSASNEFYSKNVTTMKKAGGTTGDWGINWKEQRTRPKRNILRTCVMSLICVAPCIFILLVIL